MRFHIKCACLQTSQLLRALYSFDTQRYVIIFSRQIQHTFKNHKLILFQCISTFTDTMCALK